MNDVSNSLLRPQTLTCMALWKSTAVVGNFDGLVATARVKRTRNAPIFAETPSKVRKCIARIEIDLVIIPLPLRPCVHSLARRKAPCNLLLRKCRTGGGGAAKHRFEEGGEKGSLGNFLLSKLHRRGAWNGMRWDLILLSHVIALRPTVPPTVSLSLCHRSRRPRPL